MISDKNVSVLHVADKTIYLIGTAHVSQNSVDLVKQVISEVQPSVVTVELCDSRYASLKDPNRWKNTDIYTVIKEGKAYVLLAQLVLAAFQKKLGKNLDVRPGAEMIQAISSAEDIKAQLVLADRDIKVTLRRTWASLGFWSMMKVICSMIAGVFVNEEVGADEVERLKASDALEEMMKEFSEALPEVKTALIDERDQYLAMKIKQAPGQCVVAVVGAGHVSGIKRWITHDVNLKAIEEIPAKKLSTRLLGWSMPILLVGLIIWGFYSGGAEKGWEQVFTWAWVTASSAALGALLSLAHPLSILSAFLSAPLTTIHPLLAAGHISGLVEATVRRPKVADLETIADDISSVRGIFKNRVSRVLLVMILTNLTTSFGTFLAIYLLSK